MRDAKRRALLEEATARYEAALPGSPAATYLEARGIDATVARIARLGAVVDPISEHEPFKGRLWIPYVTPSGVVAGKFRGLTSTGETPSDTSKPSSAKYLTPPGQKTHLFNVLAFQQNEHSIAVCEGELDALTLTHCCDIPAVGVPGVKSWRPWYGRMFDGYERVFMVADNDTKHEANPGMELARKVLEEVPQATLVRMPENVDVNDLYVRAGRQAVRDLIFA